MEHGVCDLEQGCERVFFPIKGQCFFSMHTMKYLYDVVCEGGECPGHFCRYPGDACKAQPYTNEQKDGSHPRAYFEMED